MEASQEASHPTNFSYMTRLDPLDELIIVNPPPIWFGLAALVSGCQRSTMTDSAGYRAVSEVTTGVWDERGLCHWQSDVVRVCQWVEAFR